MSTFYVVRHGESVANLLHEKGKAHTLVWSKLGTALSEKGIQQAETLAQIIKDIHFDAAFSSDFIRAHQTAKILTQGKKLAVQVTHRIRERMFGILEKDPFGDALWETMQKEIQKLSHEDALKHKPSVDAESMDDAASRLITFLREIAISYKNKTILVVCHGNLMRSMLLHLDFATSQQLQHASIENTGYFIVETNGKDFAIKKAVGIHTIA